MDEYPMPAVVTRQAWDQARAELLAREKAHTRAGDEVAAARRRMPMTRVDPVKVIGARGEIPLHDVFEGRRMLLAYFFMWNVGKPHHKQCEGCTHTQVAMTDMVRAYLHARDVTYAVFSMGPLDEILAYRDFMGWDAPWYSIANSAPTLKTRDGGDVRSYFRDGEQVYLAYENKWRGVEPMLPTLQLLDLTPFGRQEKWEDSPPGTPHENSGSWWRKDGRPIAQWLRTSEPVEQK